MEQEKIHQGALSEEQEVLSQEQEVAPSEEQEVESQNASDKMAEKKSPRKRSVEELDSDEVL